MKTYRAAVIGCSRMGAFIDHEVVNYRGIVRPYSHAAGFYAEERTDLVACADLRPSVMDEFGKQYDVPKQHRYTDYREMIERENLDIVGVATQPEQRAEVVIYAAEHGVKAIYAEKAMAASMDEATAMVEAVESNGVAFNLGTNNRWNTGFDKMKEVIDSSTLGKLRTLIIYSNQTLFNKASHNFDLLLRLNSDCPAEWVTAFLPKGDDQIDGDLVREDPIGQGTISFENGVMAHALLAPTGGTEAICENGLVRRLDGREREIRRSTDVKGWRTCLIPEAFPEFEKTSATTNLIKDLVHALDRGDATTRGGVRCAYASTELIFAFMESHLRNGERISLPLKGSKLRLRRDRGPAQPRFKPKAASS